MYRFDLTDAQWERLAPLFPDRYHHGQAGHPWKDTPQRYGPWQTVYERFNRWRKDGTWAKILDALLLPFPGRTLQEKRFGGKEFGSSVAFEAERKASMVEDTIRQLHLRIQTNALALVLESGASFRIAGTNQRACTPP